MDTTLKYCITFLAGFFLGLFVIAYFSTESVLCSDKHPCEMEYRNGSWVIKK